MIVKDILEIAVGEGTKADPRPHKEIARLLNQKKKFYQKLKGIKKDIFDRHILSSPYSDTRIIYGEKEDINQIWVGIDADTSELLLIKKVSQEKNKRPLVISHHPMGRAYANFYQVMDMQSDILVQQGLGHSVAEALTFKRKNEVARKISPVNHFKASDAARILKIPCMCIHTPADNQVKEYLDKFFKSKSPMLLGDLVDLLLEIPEYYDGALKGSPPTLLTGKESSKCGRIFVDMTGGTEGSAELLEKLSYAGVSTVVCMHMSEAHFKNAKKFNVNVVIAGHISSDNLGLNLLLDKIIKKTGKIEIAEFSGFKRISRV